jgi:hypothetical protein
MSKESPSFKLAESNFNFGFGVHGTKSDWVYDEVA